MGLFFGHVRSRAETKYMLRFPDIVSASEKNCAFVRHRGGETVCGLKLTGYLGSGRFSNVYRSGGVAVKVYRQTAVDQEYYVNEVSILNLLCKAGCGDTGYLGTGVHLGFDKDLRPCIYPCIIMECGDTTLSKFIDKTKPSEIDWRLLMSQILDGLSQIHAAGIVHCDIKPSNILVRYTAKGVITRISDFGGSCVEGCPFDSRPGSPEYNPPEIILKAGYTQKADIWSAACVAFRLITGSRLFTVNGVSGFRYDDGYDVDGSSECSEDSPMSRSSSSSLDTSQSSAEEDTRLVQSMYRLLGPFPPETLGGDLAAKHLGPAGVPHNYTAEPGQFVRLFNEQYAGKLGSETAACSNFILKGLVYLPGSRPTAKEYMNSLGSIE